MNETKQRTQTYYDITYEDVAQCLTDDWQTAKDITAELLPTLDNDAEMMYNSNRAYDSVVLCAVTKVRRYLNSAVKFGIGESEKRKNDKNYVKKYYRIKEIKGE